MSIISMSLYVFTNKLGKLSFFFHIDMCVDYGSKKKKSLYKITDTHTSLITHA